MKIIGTRKMIVNLCCIVALTIVILTYVLTKTPIDASALLGMSMIPAIGGVHTLKNKFGKNLPPVDVQMKKTD